MKEIAGASQEARSEILCQPIRPHRTRSVVTWCAVRGPWTGRGWRGNWRI